MGARRDGRGSGRLERLRIDRRHAALVALRHWEEEAQGKTCRCRHCEGEQKQTRPPRTVSPYLCILPVPHTCSRESSAICNGKTILRPAEAIQHIDNILLAVDAASNCDYCGSTTYSTGDRRVVNVLGMPWRNYEDTDTKSGCLNQTTSASTGEIRLVRTDCRRGTCPAGSSRSRFGHRSHDHDGRLSTTILSTILNTTLNNVATANLQTPRDINLVLGRLPTILASRTFESTGIYAELMGLTYHFRRYPVRVTQIRISMKRGY